MRGFWPFVAVGAFWAGQAMALDPAALDKACEAREGAACDTLAQAYLGGDGVARDEATGIVYLKKACERGADAACGTLGDLVRGDSGPDRQRRESTLQYFLGRCDAHQALGCAEAATFYREVEGYEDAYLALLYDQMACEHGLAASCTLTGVGFETGQGIGADAVRARVYYGRACDGGDADGCGRLSEMALAGRGGPEDKAAGDAARARACALGAAAYCE